MSRLSVDDAQKVFDELASRNGIEDRSAARVEDLLPQIHSAQSFLPTLREEDKFEELVDIWGAQNECGGVLRTVQHKDPFSHLTAHTDPSVSLDNAAASPAKEGMPFAGANADPFAHIGDLSN